MQSCLSRGPRVPPIVLAYPQVYACLIAPSADTPPLRGTIAKCFELAKNRPVEAYKRCDSYMGMDERHALFTVWSSEKDVPDIFILAGFGDGFGPGDTCPSKAELQAGHYGPLLPIPLLL